ncbi:phasin family protein [Halomonas alkalicola]|uniref:Phasin family protein n=1 Tax=Halomonas alkalicola TaxID=1930622 RepID=A0ABY9H2R9_9GAMM|nr:phasin family protein [Halomonas alkalicola]WLI72772.1 phasin family protein [Halomonas alkalicola]
MTKATTQKATEQFEGLFVAPARAYGSLTLEYYEKLMAAQMEAARTYTDLGLAQARAWVDARDVEGFKKTMEGQQKAAQDLGERMKADAEKVNALGQDFLQKSQKLVEESMKSATAAAK